MTTNRPVKEIDFFNEQKEDINFQKDTKEVREYLKLFELTGGKHTSDANVNSFLKAKKIPAKYFARNRIRSSSGVQNFEHAVGYLVKKYKLPEQYYKWIRNFLLNEGYTHETALDSPIITYTKQLDEDLESHSDRVLKMSKKERENYLTSGGQCEEGNIEHKYESYIKEMDDTFPISIKFSPFISPGKLAKFITEHKEKIEEIQQKYKDKFNKRIGKARKKTEQVTKEETLIMKLYFEGKTDEEIKKAVDALHRSDDKTLFREFNPSRIRKIINKRKNFGI